MENENLENKSAEELIDIIEARDEIIQSFKDREENIIPFIKGEITEEELKAKISLRDVLLIKGFISELQ